MAQTKALAGACAKGLTAAAAHYHRARAQHRGRAAVHPKSACAPSAGTASSVTRAKKQRAGNPIKLPGRRSPGRLTATLADLVLTKSEADHGRKLAALSDDEFEDRLRQPGQLANASYRSVPVATKSILRAPGRAQFTLGEILCAYSRAC